MMRNRQLCRIATEAEQQLWKHLRNRQIAGAKFRRQVPVDRYIVDFLCEGQRSSSSWMVVNTSDAPYMTNSARQS